MPSYWRLKILFFFFQAEDGIRDADVTGVQTCALPIYDDWQPSSYRDGSAVTSFVWRPRTWKQARRFVVRRDPLAQGEQLALEEGEWHYWALVSNDSERSADELEIWHRAK